MGKRFLKFRKSLKWKWELPSRFELLLLALASICLIIFDFAQNMYQKPASIHVNTILGVEAITVFWVFFVLYAFFLVWLYALAIYSRGTSHKWDFLFGSLAIVGSMFILVGAIASIYYEPSEGVSFFYNISQITLYHFFGIALQIISLGYFFLTE